MAKRFDCEGDWKSLPGSSSACAKAHGQGRAQRDWRSVVMDSRSDMRLERQVGASYGKNVVPLECKWEATEEF